MPQEKLIQTANIWLSCTECVISAGLLWWISLVHKRAVKLKKKKKNKYGKSESWNMKSWQAPLIWTKLEQIYKSSPYQEYISFFLGGGEGGKL